jgi:hypothetical protein
LNNEQLIFVLVAILLLITLVVIGVLVYFGHRFLRLKELERLNQIQKSTKETMEEIQDLKQVDKTVDPELLKALRAKHKDTEHLASVCVDHPDEPAVKRCAISGDPFCEHCITRQNDTWVARKYLDLFLDSDWEELMMLPDHKTEHDVKTRLSKMKSDLWKKKGIPVIIQSNYKINVEEDEIESYTVVVVRQEDRNYVKKELSFVH